MTKARRNAIAALVSLAVVGALSAPAQGAVLVRGRLVNGSYRWRPATATVARGTQITWLAVTGTHTVQSYGGNWTYHRNLSAGSSVTRTFRVRGTFRYYCQIHGYVSGGVCTGMCGKIVVT
jgi:plastocyanin